MPRPDIGRRPIPVRMDPDLLALLEADSDDEGITRSALIRNIIRDHYTRIEAAAAAGH